MENQHRKIKGYRELSKEEIAMINEVKEKAEELNYTLNRVAELKGADLRWFSVGRTDLQKGFMSIIRSIAKPESF